MGKSPKKGRKPAGRSKTSAGKRIVPSIAPSPALKDENDRLTTATILVEGQSSALERSVLRWTVRSLALIGSIGIILMGFFTERHWGSEEPTLFNIPFTYVHEGKLALPVYGYWYRASYDQLFVHPPTHYWEVGWLMKLGVPLYYAEATPVVLLSILILILIVTSRFSLILQLGLAAGVAFGMGFVAVTGSGDYSFHLRPDAHLAVALLAGLIALQASRIQNWENKRLFLGSFLVTYASTIHYPALFAWVGIVVFVFLAFRDLPWRQSCFKVLLMVVGGSLAGVPYLVVHLIPNLAYLQQYSSYISFEHIRDTIVQNASYYRGILQSLNEWGFPGLVYAWPLKEALRFSVPPFIVAVFLLFWSKQTRAMALGVLPFATFLFAISSRKMASYYDLECMLLLVGVWVWAAAGWMKLAAFLPGRSQILAAPLFALVATGLMFGCTPEMANVRLRPQHHEFPLLRTLSKEIMGPHATVASIHPLWYFSGAERWFDLTNDLLSNPATMDPHIYWSRFDAVAMPHTTSLHTNTGVDEASLYADGILRFRGFMGSRIAPEHRWVWLSPRVGQPVDGFVWRDGTLQRFRQAPEGEYAVVSAVTSDEEGMLKALSPIQYWDSDMPKLASEQHPRSLLFMLLSEQQLDSHAGIFSEGKPLEVIRGSLQTVDPNSFSGPSPKSDQVEIVRSYAELLPSLATAVPGASRISLQFRTFGSGVETAQAGSDGYRISTKEAGWGVLAMAEIPKTMEGHYYKVSLDMEMKAGGAAIQVFSGVELKPVATVYQEIPLKHTSKSFVFQAPQREPLRVSVEAWNPNKVAPVDVTVRNATIQEVQLAR